VSPFLCAVTIYSTQRVLPRLAATQNGRGVIPRRIRVDVFYFGSASFTNFTRSAWYFAADGWSMYTMWPAS
jgi:hypothetical protein